MPETIEQYKKRILSHAEGKDPIATQRETPAVLGRLLSSVSRKKLIERPQPDKWSAAEVMAHLAEAEVAAFWRYRQMIEYSGSEILPFDQNLWAELGDYRSVDVAESLETFRLLRARNLELFSRLTDEQWERYGMHKERGKESVRYYVRMIAGHDLNHVEQVRKILA